MKPFLLLLLFAITVKVKGSWLHDKREVEDVSDESSEETSKPQSQPFIPFSVISGPIGEDSSSGDRDRSLLRHHVDFDEMFPDQDQVAMSGEHQHNIWRSHPPHQPHPEDDEGNESFSDDLVVPDFSNMFQNLPQIGVHVVNHQQQQPPWWQTVNVNPSRQWWKGSNVCIKRQETEESSITGGTATQNVSFTLNGTDEQFHMQFSACESLDTRYSCQTRMYGAQVTKTIRTDYECCSGYSLDVEKTGCAKGHFQNVLTTIQQLGGGEFLRLVRSVRGLSERLVRDNLTVFLPNDAAILSFGSLPPIRRRRNILRHTKNDPAGRNVRRRPMADGNNVKSHIHQGEMYPIPFDELGDRDNENEDFSSLYVVKKLDVDENSLDAVLEESNNNLSQTLLNHLVEGSISTDDFVDEKVIYSENTENDGGRGDGGGVNGVGRGSGGGRGVLRLNTWDVGFEKVKTVNCARLMSSNHRCTNGIVHIVDRVIRPVSQSIHDVLSSRPELSVWSSLVTSSKDMDKLLRDSRQHLTLFAPTNKALDKVGPALLLKLRSGDSCLKRIVSRHIIPITFCSSIINGKGQIRTVEHELLDIERTSEDKLYINGSQIIVRDIVTTNGVVHVIDAVLLSNNDKPVNEVMEREGLSAFVRAIRRVGLEQEFNAMNNITVFAPSDAAFASLSREIFNDDGKLRDVLLYHVVTPELRVCHFSHQQLLQSSLVNASLRINLYSSFPLGSEVATTVSCGVLRKSNIVGCGGVVHTLDRVLLPSQLDIVATLKTQQNFTIFSRLLSENEELFRTLKNQRQDTFFTLFVPTDAAFYALPQQQLASILNNRNEAVRVLKRHITSDSLCCAGVPRQIYFMTKRVTTLGDVNVPVYRDPKGQVVFGNALVTTCDLMASNGIIHTVDKVLAVPNKSRRSGLFQVPETIDFDVGGFFLRL